MNEEVIKQCVADAINPDDYQKGCYRTAQDDAAFAIRLYRTRHVAPLEQENAELRALVKDLTAQAKADGERIGQLEAKVAPLVEAATKARCIAMEQAVKARVPECGNFGEIAQDLDAALAPFQQETLSALAEAKKVETVKIGDRFRDAWGDHRVTWEVVGEYPSSVVIKGCWPNGPSITEDRAKLLNPSIYVRVEAEQEARDA